MKRLLPFLLLFAAVSAPAQTCTTPVCTAASASESDVLAALPSPGNTNATVVVNVPTSTGFWTSQLTYSIPAAVTNLTIQGNTTVSCTGTPGTSSYACTPTDHTILQDNNTTTNFTFLQINAGGGGAGSSLRITGITLQGGTGITKGQGTILVYGPVHNLRIDHNHFNEATYTGGSASFWMHENGEVEGVADHNVFDNGSTGIVQANIASNNIGDSIGYGDGTWANPTPWGTAGNFFLESNIMNGGTFTDCDTAGNVVVRYNTANGTTTVSAAMHSHGTYSNSGRARSCRSYEFYHNYVVGPGAGTNALVGSEGGPSLAWGNTLVSGYQNFANIDLARNRVGETAPPNGWGYCGTSSGGPSAWDGNNVSTTGYPCLDGLGRGQGQALNGQPFPNTLNSATSSISWPHQYLEPIYYFDNTLTGVSTAVVVGSDFTPNLDVFADCNALNSSCTGTFNGTAGTGSGVLASRPSTCTAGPGGTYGTSPTGSYGVGYYATDNNTFYVCTATNTWTAIYTPYTYPHPLVGGNPQASTPTFSPASGAPPQTVTISAASGGVICYNTTGSPATNGTTGCTTGTLVTGTVSVSAPETLYAVAGGTGFTDSNVGTATYSAGTAVATPTFTPGTLTAPDSITVATTTSSATCFYTTDGSTPTTSSTQYTHPLWVAQNQTIKAICSAAGHTDSAVGSQPYAPIPQRTRFSMSTTSASVNPVPFPIDNRMCCGTNVASLEASRGTYTLSSFHNFITQSIAQGSYTWYTIQGFPPWMYTTSWQASTVENINNFILVSGNVFRATAVTGDQKTGGSLPTFNTTVGATTTDNHVTWTSIGPNAAMSAAPIDLYTTAPCQNVLTGTTTKNCGMKEFVTSLMEDRTGLSSQPANPVNCPNLDFLEVINEFNTDDLGGSTGWSGTYADLAALANDISSVVHAWCSNTVVVGGSASGIVGYHSNGEDAHFDAALETFLSDWAGISGASLPDAVSFHAYPARQTVSPVPFPTTIVSHTDAACTSGNTPNLSCYIAVDIEGSQIQGSSVLQNSAIVPWAGNLPVYSTEGGFGEVSQLSGTSIYQAYVSQYMLSLAAQKIPVVMMYAANDATWGCYWNCGSGLSLWYTAFTQTQAWLNAHTVTGVLTSTAITGGNKWSLQLDSGAAEIDFCDAWLTSCTTTTAFTTQQTLLGTTSPTGGSLTLTQSPTLLTNTPVCGNPTQNGPNYSGTYTVPPTTLPLVVGFTSPTSGCTMHYTTDGSSPTCGSAAYSGSSSLSATTTVRVIACQTSYTSSSVMGGTWTINGPPGAPTNITIIVIGD